MSEPNAEPTNRPIEGAKESPLAYFLGLSFHPNIKLDNKNGLEFAAALSDYIEPKNVSLESNQWSFSSARGELRIVIQHSGLHLQAERPSHPLEWYEDRFATALKRWQEQFSPEMLLESKAMIRSLLPVDGDAREFLRCHVMNMDPSRLGPMQRPLHILGVRMFFPPFVKKDDADESKSQVTDWGVNVKLESWIEDPSKLFVEVDGDWPRPEKWEEESVDSVVGRLQILMDYSKDRVIPFLGYSSEEDEDK